MQETSKRTPQLRDWTVCQCCGDIDHAYYPCPCRRLRLPPERLPWGTLWAYVVLHGLACLGAAAGLYLVWRHWLPWGR